MAPPCDAPRQCGRLAARRARTRDPAAALRWRRRGRRLMSKTEHDLHEPRKLYAPSERASSPTGQRPGRKPCVHNHLNARLPVQSHWTFNVVEACHRVEHRTAASRHTRVAQYLAACLGTAHRLLSEFSVPGRTRAEFAVARLVAQDLHCARGGAHRSLARAVEAERRAGATPHRARVAAQRVVSSLGGVAGSAWHERAACGHVAHARRRWPHRFATSARRFARLRLLRARSCGACGGRGAPCPRTWRQRSARTARQLLLGKSRPVTSRGAARQFPVLTHREQVPRASRSLSRSAASVLPTRIRSLFDASASCRSAGNSVCGCSLDVTSIASQSSLPSSATTR